MGQRDSDKVRTIVVHWFMAITLSLDLASSLPLFFKRKEAREDGEEPQLLLLLSAPYSLYLYL